MRFIFRQIGLLVLLSQMPTHGQVTCRYAWPTLGYRGGPQGFWSGSLMSFVCQGLVLPKKLVRPTKVPRPYKVEGISVFVGVDANGGLPAPILEVADLGDYQQITFQVPWEYERYSLSPTGIRIDGSQELNLVFDDGTKVQWSTYSQVPPVSPFFEDQNGFALAQHSKDLSGVTTANPAHPGEAIILHAANLGPVVNPPPTGHPTPPYFSTLFSREGALSGPIVLDQSKGFFRVGMFDGLMSHVWFPQVLSISLEPGEISRYLVSIQIPDASQLQSGTSFGLYGQWFFCRGEQGPNPFCRQGEYVNTGPSPSKLALTVP